MVLAPWLGLAYLTADRIHHDLGELALSNQLQPAVAEVKLLAVLERGLRNEGGSAALTVAARAAGVPLELAETLSGVEIRADLARERLLVDRAVAELPRTSNFRLEGLETVRRRFDSPTTTDPYDPGYSELRTRTSMAIEDGMRHVSILSAQLGSDADLLANLLTLDAAMQASQNAIVESNLLLNRATGSLLDKFGMNLICESHAATNLSLRTLARLETPTGSRLAADVLASSDQALIEAEVARNDGSAGRTKNPLQVVRDLYPILARRNVRLGEISDRSADAISTRAWLLAGGQRRAIEQTVAWLLVSLVGTLTLALLAAVSIARPLRRLGQQAHQLVEGNEDLRPLRLTGPRELVVSAQAFNELATTLSAVQGQADALAAGRLETAALTIPNVRLSSSVQKAVQRLSESIQLNNKLRDDFAYAAGHDALTGLPNRSTIYNGIQRQLDEYSEVGILFVDLDRFKGINDQHGHQAGDEVLREVSKRFVSCAGSFGVVGRLGGDEFVVVCSRAVTHAELADLADRIVAAASVPLELGSKSFIIGASVGIAIATPGDTASALLLEADQALYKAKAAGGSRVALSR